MRRRFLGDQPDARLVVAMAGGGADGFVLFDTLLRAIPLLSAAMPCSVLVITGPFLAPAERARLQRLADGLPVHLVPSVNDSLSHLAAADLVVGMAGYNTTAEILSLGARALLVPRAGPSAEQQIRARAFAARGWVDWVPPRSLSTAALGAAMIAAFDTPRAPLFNRPDLRGRQRAAHHLLGHSAPKQINGTLRSLMMSGAAEGRDDPDLGRLFGEG